MILVKQTSCLPYQVPPKHEPKLSPWSFRGPQTHPFAESNPTFSRFHVNHCTPYTYTGTPLIFPINYCTPYTYTNTSARFSITLCTPCTYIKDCAFCVINLRQGSTLPKPLTHLAHIAKLSQNCATGGPPVRPTPQSHTQPSSSDPHLPFINPCEGAPLQTSAPPTMAKIPFFQARSFT